MCDPLVDAVPAEHFAHPPYNAELLSENGWACVTNMYGINCLTFKSKAGAVITDMNTAIKIADKWNKT